VRSGPVIMMLRYLALFSLVAACSAHWSNCHLREIDICSGTLAVFAKNKPDNVPFEEELDDRCGNVDDFFTCVSNYTKSCFKPEQHEFLDWLMRGPIKMKDGLCDPDHPLREEYLEHIPCLRSLSKRRLLSRPCVQDALVGIEAVINAKFSNRVNLTCCVYQRARSCFLDEIAETCGPDTLDFVTRGIRMVGSRLPEYICEDATEDNKMCDGLPVRGSRMVGAKSRFKLLNHLLYILKTIQHD